MTERTRVFVATPCYGGDLKMAYVLSALKLQAAATARGIDIQFHLIGNESLIVRARNELAHQFLASGASHLLFIDADIGFEPESVFRLLDCGTDVSAAAYPLKHIDWAKVQRVAEAKRRNLASSSLDYVVTWEGDQITARGDGFAKVRYAGTGFLMMKRSALVRLCDAHPELKYRANHKSNDLNTGDLVRADLDRVSLFECMIDKTTGSICPKITRSAGAGSTSAAKSGSTFEASSRISVHTPSAAASPTSWPEPDRPSEKDSSLNKEGLAFRRGLPAGSAQLSELALRIGLLALPARILLLLAGLLAAALLLLAGLLTGVLVGLARILIWVAHSATPFAVIKLGTTRTSQARLLGEQGFRRDHCKARPCRPCDIGTASAKLVMYKPFLLLPRCCRGRGSTVRKRHDATDQAAGALAASPSTWRFRAKWEPVRVKQARPDQHESLVGSQPNRL
ncbi:hypothetical protein [Bradyrhizobium elkanii]|uniref:hypothetical protein n=1 Tax=Bradyrhizobium elkanii TaxID=29448 RepID=UPI001F0B5BCD|nr:hypothetical protein [Bradyrhizobium elkanii]